MKGMLIKEMINMRTYGKTAVILIAFFVVMGVIQQSMTVMASMLGCAVLVFSMVAGLNSMSFDAASKWDCYALSMPIRRRDVVLSKYLFSMGLGAVSMLILLVIMWAASLFFPQVVLGSLVWILLGVYGAGVVLLSILFPLLYRFGVEKARFAILAVALVPSIGGMLLGRRGSRLPDFFSEIDWNTVIMALPFVIVLLAVGSYFLSVRIFEHKEL